MRFFVLLLSFLYLPIALQAQKKVRYCVEPDTAGQVVTYGSVVKIRYFKLGPNGNRQEIKYKAVKRLLVLETDYGQLDASGNLIFPLTSTNKNFVGVTILLKPQISTMAVVSQVNINMNYKSNLTLNFSGKQGGSQKTGNNGVLRLFDLTANGDAGGNGLSGENGKDIHVRIKKERDSLLNNAVYVFTVSEIANGKVYYYRCLYPENGIRINCDGGNGGDGNNGENGRDKTGEREAEKGGNGGHGERGGNGGMLTVIVHPNAAEIIPQLKTSNNGGIGGKAGEGGIGGADERNKEGLETKKYSFDGNTGLKGENGLNGPQIVIRVDDF